MCHSETEQAYRRVGFLAYDVASSGFLKRLSCGDSIGTKASQPQSSCERNALRDKRNAVASWDPRSTHQVQTVTQVMNYNS